VLVENEHQAGKRSVPRVAACLEGDLIYPHLRWGDLDRWGHREPGHVLIPHDPETRTPVPEPCLRRKWPRTYGYLDCFRAVLQERKSRVLPRTPFYALMGFGRYSLAPFKVAWRSMGHSIRPAVLASHQDGAGTKPVIPQWTIYFVPVDEREEADFVCAVLGSMAVNFVARAYAVKGGKSFGSANLLNYVKIPVFNRSDPVHRTLASLSLEAHRLAAGGRILPAAGGGVRQSGPRSRLTANLGKDPRLAGRIGEIEREIDRLVCRLWNLTQAEQAAIEKSFALLGPEAAQ
jgi:hypothetical protein